jgi:hypothetical protein
VGQVSFFVVVFWYWNLDSGPCICQTGTLELEPHHQPCDLPPLKVRFPTENPPSVAGRQGGGREITRDNECSNETEKTGFEECHLD